MPEKHLPSIAQNIRRYRLQKGLSMDRLSKLANVAFHTITKIESGNTPNPTISTIKKIADALGVKIDNLVREKI
jgi:transcriptional regulator with XRE-family HTH domain